MYKSWKNISNTKKLLEKNISHVNTVDILLEVSLKTQMVQVQIWKKFQILSTLSLLFPLHNENCTATRCTAKSISTLCAWHSDCHTGFSFFLTIDWNLLTVHIFGLGLGHRFGSILMIFIFSHFLKIYIILYMWVISTHFPLELLYNML